MFAVGDKVYYKGKSIPKKIYTIEKIVGDFVFVKGIEGRYKLSSFTTTNPAEKLTLLQELVKKTGNNAGTCSYAIRFADGRDRFQIRDVCHARLRFGGFSEPADQRYLEHKPIAVALNVVGHLKDQDKAPAMKRMYEYILLRSPWRFAFIQKPLEDVFTSGVYLDINQSYSFVVAAAIALRTVSEFPYRTKFFCRAADAGIPEHIAFIMSVMLDRDTPKLMDFGGGHHVMSTYENNIRDVFKFFKDGPPDLKEKPYKDTVDRSYTIFKSVSPKPKVRGSWMDAIKTVAPHLIVKKKDGWAYCPDYIVVETDKQLVSLAFLLKEHFDA